MASWSKIARRIRIPLAFALAALYLWLAAPTTRSLLLGAAVVIPGLLLRTLASGQVQKNEQLATGGPYAYTRNPLYLGSLILAAGYAMAARSWWIATIMVVMFFAIYLPVIRGEEAYLREHFAEFEEYCRRVPRLFPRFTAFRESDSGFSWALYRKHREYNAWVGSAAILLALAAKLYWMSH
ncbi:MAG TPA: isoprenylcysteine carboxylmethyltransferase family protein [Terriglobales bacterium]|nr:isoprenylcysteine carboxylmethyltransferase family protein [Terriglobales bacterium]